MMPVAVKEILSCRERLGITEGIDPKAAPRFVRRLSRYYGGESFDRNTEVPQSLVIVSRDALMAQGGHRREYWLDGPNTANAACLAISMRDLPDLFRRYSIRTGTPVFASLYDEELLHSRLVRLLQEKGKRKTTVHGVLVQVFGRGVLILGESGIGKTSCGIALMGSGARWVADDVVALQARGDFLYGSGHEAIRDMIAVRGRGILQTKDLFEKGSILRETRVDMVFRLIRRSGSDRYAEDHSFEQFVGIRLPCININTEPHHQGITQRVSSWARDLRLFEQNEVKGVN